MRAQLIPIDSGPAIEITKDITVVGRKKTCDIQLMHRSVSKFHCVIAKTSGLLLVRDLGSTNGTRVNGERVRRAALLPNDTLSVAGFKFRVYLGPSEGGRPAFERTEHMELDPADPLLERDPKSSPAESNGSDSHAIDAAASTPT